MILLYLSMFFMLVFGFLCLVSLAMYMTWREPKYLKVTIFSILVLLMFVIALFADEITNLIKLCLDEYI